MSADARYRASVAAKSVLIAGTAYFVPVFAAGFAAGTIRVLVLTPWLGRLGAVIAELPVMLAVSWLVCAWVLRVFKVSPRLGARIAVGVIAFALLMLAEIGVSMLVFGRSVAANTSRATAASMALSGLPGKSPSVRFPRHGCSRAWLIDQSQGEARADSSW